MKNSQKIVVDLNLEHLDLRGKYSLDIANLENVYSDLKKVILQVKEQGLGNQKISYSEAEFINKVPKVELKAINIIKLDNDEDYFVKDNLRNFQNINHLQAFKNGEMVLTERFREIKKLNILYNQKLDDMLSRLEKIYQNWRSGSYTQSDILNQYLEISHEFDTFTDAEYKKYVQYFNHTGNFVETINNFDFDMYDKKFIGYKKYQQ